MAAATQTKNKTTETRKLASAPSVLPLYTRAALPLLPGASRLPFVPGGGGEIPDVRLELDGVTADPSAVVTSDPAAGAGVRPGIVPLLYVKCRDGLRRATPIPPSAYGVHWPQVGPATLNPPRP